MDDAKGNAEAVLHSETLGLRMARKDAVWSEE